MVNDVSKRGLELGEQHWTYVEKLLRTHGEDEKIIQKINFHYVQAAKHFYKHGFQDGKAEKK
jgi:hypothetical protein